MELKRAKGNPGKRALPLVADAPGGAIRPLAKLRPAAISVWHQLAPELERLNFLRATDRQAFGRYCDTLAHYWEVTTALRKAGGDTYETESLHGKMLRVHPLFLVQERLFRRLTELEDRFGLSPAARQSIMLRLAQAQPMLPFDAKPGAPQPAASPDAQSPIGLLNDPQGSVH